MFIFLLLERDFLDLLVVISWSYVVMSCIYREIETTRFIKVIGTFLLFKNVVKQIKLCMQR